MGDPPVLHIPQCLRTKLMQQNQKPVVKLFLTYQIL